jgi:hypothetical protein
MSKKEPFVPKSLREVWDWKESISREVENLPVKEAIKAILDKGNAAALELNLPTASPAKPRK